MAYTPTDEQVEAARTAQEVEDKLLRSMKVLRSGVTNTKSQDTYHNDYLQYQHKMASFFNACDCAPEQVRAARRAVLNSGESFDADNARYYPPIARSMAFSTDPDGTSRPSQNINSYGYDGEHRYLDVVFNSSNTIYRYLDVTNEEYEALEAAASKGSHISRHIKSHSFIKVER